MSTAPSSHCRRTLCANTIPASLAAERLCLDHFLDEAFVRTGEALERCREGHPIQPKGLEWLLADALAIVKNLEEGAGEPSPEQRDRMLELLLILSNLQEYAAHHSTDIGGMATGMAKGGVGTAKGAAGAATGLVDGLFGKKKN